MLRVSLMTFLCKVVKIRVGSFLQLPNEFLGDLAKTIQTFHSHQNSSATKNLKPYLQAIASSSVTLLPEPLEHSLGTCWSVVKETQKPLALFFLTRNWPLRAANGVQWPTNCDNVLQEFAGCDAHKSSSQLWASDLGMIVRWFIEETEMKTQS